jgi:hypothetical protein
VCACVYVCVRALRCAVAYCGMLASLLNINKYTYVDVYINKKNTCTNIYIIPLHARESAKYK